MQGKLSILVDDGVTGIGAALKADDNIGVICQGIRDLSLALIAPIGSNDCFNHDKSSCIYRTAYA